MSFFNLGYTNLRGNRVKQYTYACEHGSECILFKQKATRNYMGDQKRINKLALLGYFGNDEAYIPYNLKYARVVPRVLNYEISCHF